MFSALIFKKWYQFTLFSQRKPNKREREKNMERTTNNFFVVWFYKLAGSKVFRPEGGIYCTVNFLRRGRRREGGMSYVDQWSFFCWSRAKKGTCLSLSNSTNMKHLWGRPSFLELYCICPAPSFKWCHEYLSLAVNYCRRTRVPVVVWLAWAVCGHRTGSPLSVWFVILATQTNRK